jgi:hypothetical protein
MRASRSRSIVLLLDCCYGGAFGQGVAVRASGEANVLDSFPGGKLGGGRGRAVITASSAMEYAFEGDRLADEADRRPSVFTSALVEGMETGDADRDEDGWVRRAVGDRRRAFGGARPTRRLELISGILGTALGALILYFVNQEWSGYVYLFSLYFLALGVVWVLIGIARRQAIRMS